MFVAGHSLSQFWTLQKINKTHGDITTSKSLCNFAFYFIPHLVMLQWTSFEKFIFLMLYCRSQAKIGMLEFSYNVQQKPRNLKSRLKLKWSFNNLHLETARH